MTYFDLRARIQVQDISDPPVTASNCCSGEGPKENGAAVCERRDEQSPAGSRSTWIEQSRPERERTCVCVCVYVWCVPSFPFFFFVRTQRAVHAQQSDKARVVWLAVTLERRGEAEVVVTDNTTMSNHRR